MSPVKDLSDQGWIKALNENMNKCYIFTHIIHLHSNTNITTVNGNITKLQFDYSALVKRSWV